MTIAHITSLTRLKYYPALVLNLLKDFLERSKISSIPNLHSVSIGYPSKETEDGLKLTSAKSINISDWFNDLCYIAHMGNILCLSLAVASTIHGFSNQSQKRGISMSLPNKNMNQNLDLALNMYEKDNNIIAEIDVAGIKPQDLKVEIEDGKLHIFGERHAKEEVKEEHYYYKESSYGRFDRLVSLPDNIDEEAMTYEVVDGLLTVIIPKK